MLKLCAELGLRQNLKLVVIIAFVVVLEEAVEQKSVMPTGYLTTLEHIGDGRSSVWEELPSSPETFGLIPNYDWCDDVSCNNMQWDQRLAAVTNNNVSATYSAASEVVSDIASIQSSDSVTVPECEPSEENAWLDLDEAMNGVIIDPVKLSDIGLYLPSVSADDVELLLSSPLVSAAVPAAASIPSHGYYFPECHEQSSDSSVQLTEVESSVAVSYFPLEYENQSSPESSESCVSSTPACSDRKQRKKEQNKTAAQKYRQKKRGEQGLVVTEYEQLERKNIELHTRVDEMTREVEYLKGLIEEICAA